MSLTPLTLFDYAALDAETRIVVQQRTGEIRGLMRRAAQDIVDIGLKLIEVKARLGHGRFLPWLTMEFDWSERTAQNFMLVGERFKSANFADLSFAPSALYLLAAPSTPESARQEALNRAAADEEITHGTAKAIVEEHRPASSVLPAPVRSFLWEAQEEAEHQDLREKGTYPPQPNEDDFEEDEEEPVPLSARAEPLPPEPVRPPPPPPRYPYSDHFISWLRQVFNQSHIVHIQGGGIKTMLAEPEKWHPTETQEFILPMLEVLARTIEEFHKEIENHVRTQKAQEERR